MQYGGHIEREHGKPGACGYYEDFDPKAASLEVVPVEDSNPVRTQHVLIATVRDADGNPLDSRRVEWMITDGVGAIVEVDESGWYDTRGYKVDNRYAVSHTNRDPHVLTRGNSNSKDDIHIEKGQTWCVITSPVEGDTHVAVYAPAIYNWDKHKVFVIKHWTDATWQWPPNAVNPVGTPHDMAVKVMKSSDGAPLVGWIVNFRITEGPDAMFEPGRAKEASVKTDSAGVAKVRLVQAKPVEGTNVIAMEVIRPEDKATGQPAMKLASGQATKTWVGPRIGIQKSATPRAGVNEMIQYQIIVTNPGKADATNVMVTDNVPEGIQYVSSEPQAKQSGQTLSWSLGTLKPQGRVSILVRAKTTRTGTFENPVDVAADLGLKAHSSATTVVSAPMLTLEKTGPAEALFCDPITYTVVVRNTGDAPATNVKITDTLPDGLEMLRGGQRTVMVDAGTVAPGAAKKATYQVKATKTGVLKNTAVATADGNLKAEASSQVRIRRPMLVLTKSGPETRYLDREAAYEITVTNKGDGEARDTMLTDTLPDGLTFVRASDGGRHENGKITWNLGTLAPNASRKVSMTAMAAKLGKRTNRVDAVAVCSKASAEAATDIIGIPAVLLEMVDVEDPDLVGTDETYVITVTNQGSADGTNIRIVATLPAEQTYSSSDGPTKATVEGQKVTFAPLARLAPKAKAVYKVIVTNAKAGDVRFKVEMTSDQIGAPVMETESTNIYK